MLKTHYNPASRKFLTFTEAQQDPEAVMLYIDQPVPQPNPQQRIQQGLPELIEGKYYQRVGIGEIFTQDITETNEAGEEVIVTVDEQKLRDLNTRLKPQYKAQVEAKRLEKEKAGVAYTFPDGQGTVQTARDVDIRNVQGVVTTAQVLASQGVTDPVIDFRDQENVTHSLTPTQAIDMGMVVQTAISQHYAWAWAKKAEIDACTTIEELIAIVI